MRFKTAVGRRNNNNIGHSTIGYGGNRIGSIGLLNDKSYAGTSIVGDEGASPGALKKKQMSTNEKLKAQ